MTKASYYVAVYTLDQSEKEYSLIWKKNLYQFKLTNVNGKKIDQYHQFYIIKISITL